MGAGEGRFAEEIAEPVELEVALLPCWDGLREEERRREVRGLVEEVEAEARARDKPVLGARAVRAQHPHTRPEQLNRSPRPLGHASTRQALKELREQYRAFVAAFREAAARWRRGTSRRAFRSSPSHRVSCRGVSREFFDTLSPKNREKLRTLLRGLFAPLCLFLLLGSFFLLRDFLLHVYHKHFGSQLVSMFIRNAFDVLNRVCES